LKKQSAIFTVMSNKCIYADELIEAMDAGHTEALRRWLDAGGDPNAVIARTGYEGGTVLMRVLMCIDEPEGDAPILEMLKLLIERGADVTDSGHEDRADYPPVFWAITENRVEMVKLLLDAGTSLDFRTPEGETALSRPMEMEYWDMMELLVPRAPLKVIDAWASPSCDPPLGMAFRTLNFRMMELLLKHGADPQAYDPDDGTALDNIPRDTDPEVRGWIDALIKKYRKEA
jgi:ankyrin repeat protein